MKLNRKLVLILSLALSLALATGGTLAYLSDTDADVNVMTVGNVYIKQLEYERVPQAGHEQTNDAWESVGEIDKYGYTPDKVRVFRQDKPLYPAVFADGQIKWDDRLANTRAVNEHQQSWQKILSEENNAAPGSSQLFDDSVKNVIDKFVFVENIGSTNAYVRTWIALEQGSIPADEFENIIMANRNTKHWKWETVATDVEITGPDETTSTYVVKLVTYLGPTSNPTGILAPGEITYPSLLQVYMKPEATNADVEAIDGNKSGKYDILVVSQAVQAEGFNDAETALVAAFTNELPFETAEVKEALEKDFHGAYNPLAMDHWDGSADTSWYNDTATEFELTTAEQLAGLAKLVDDGNTFEGKTVKLANDFCLHCDECEAPVAEDGTPTSFNPIGYGYNVVFKGTFDGQDHTINNLYQNGWALGLDYSTEGGGLFASAVDANFKNLTIKDAEIVMECIDMGVLVGYSYGTATYENISIEGCTIANYNRYTGGVVGEVNGKHTFKNVDVDADTTVSALWGTYDCSCGGIIGGKWGNAEIIMEDCDVACTLDVFNDACSNYQYYLYRLSGMLIGMSEEVTDGTATASYLTAKNCTVTYGDWVDYTYCEFEANGKGSYAAPDEWKFSRVQEGYATGGVDPNHEHDTDESHEEEMTFDQLFGGNKGVKGGKTHDGVTVVYNNK